MQAGAAVHIGSYKANRSKDRDAKPYSGLRDRDPKAAGLPNRMQGNHVGSLEFG